MRNRFRIARRLGYKVASFARSTRVIRTVITTHLSSLTEQIVLLTCLCPGQRATVLQVPAGTSDKIEVTERYASLVG